MAEVRWSAKGLADLQRTRDFIAENSVSYALGFAHRVFAAVERLSEFPRIGRIVPEFRNEHVREILVRGYRIMYSVSEDEIVVLRIVHGARYLRRLIQRGQWSLE